MIDETDESLAALLAAADLGGACAVVFDPPNAAWAEKPPAPRCLNLFLHDVTERLESRVGDWTDVRDDRGRVVERRPPLRRYDLTYLLSAWAGSVAEDHRLLSFALRCLADVQNLPMAHRVGTLLDAGLPIPVQVAIPGAGSTENVSDIWSSLGTPPRASLSLVLTVPLTLTPSTEIGPPVAERQLTVGFDDGSFDTVASSARDKAAAARHEAMAGAPPEPDLASAGAARRRRLVTEVQKPT